MDDLDKKPAESSEVAEDAISAVLNLPEFADITDEDIAAAARELGMDISEADRQDPLRRLLLVSMVILRRL